MRFGTWHIFDAHWLATLLLKAGQHMIYFVAFKMIGKNLRKLWTTKKVEKK